jgi:hypothetical protein
MFLASSLVLHWFRPSGISLFRICHFQNLQNCRDDDPVEALRLLSKHAEEVFEYVYPIRLAIATLLSVGLLFVIGSRFGLDMLSWAADCVPLAFAVVGILLSFKKVREEHHAALTVVLIMLGIICTLVLHTGRVNEQNKHDREVSDLRGRMDVVRNQNNSVLGTLVAQGKSNQPQSEWQRRKNIEDTLRGEYILSHTNTSPEERPPDEWMNKRLEELGEPWRVSRVIPSAVPPQTAIPNLGNLRDRANKLADRIANDASFVARLRASTTTFDERNRAYEAWGRSFRIHYFDSVVGIRDEFASFHYIEPGLDRFLNQEREFENTVPLQYRANHFLLPQEIDECVDQLRKLAKMAAPQNTRNAQPLAVFEQSSVTGSTYKLVATITPRSLETSGYVFVQLQGEPASISTDFQGSKLVISPRDVVNEQLAALLRQSTPRQYVLEIGDKPLEPDIPIHIFASGAKKLHVVKALLF